MPDLVAGLPALTIAQDILWGNTAQRPPMPKAGDIYVDDEANTTLVCYADGTWTDLSAVYAPIGADYLVGTSNGTLTGEIVVGTAPGGELGGTWASPTVDSTHSGSAHHSAVTLGSDADAVLGLTGQQIDLDTQTANRVFAGPTTGSAADPTFRALVAADIPASSLYYYKTYKCTPQTAPGESITTESQSDIAHSGPSAETVTAIWSDFDAAPGTSVRFKWHYGDGNTLDSVSWTEIDDITHVTADGLTKEVTSGFTNATIPANRILKLEIVAVSDTAPTIGYFFMRTRAPLETA